MKFDTETGDQDMKLLSPSRDYTFTDLSRIKEWILK